MSKSVYQMIASVAGELAKVGISKDRKNTQGSGYSFRGIDDIYNVLGPLMSREGLVIIPRCTSRRSEERTSAAGKALFYVTVEAEFDLVSSEDGSKHTARTFGEAMDSGDKGTNKAMSAAYKYMAFQVFCIPVEGDDADAQTHEVKPAEKTAAKVLEVFAPSKQDCWNLAKELHLTPDRFREICSKAGISAEDPASQTANAFAMVWQELCAMEGKK